MTWVNHERPETDRSACPWLVLRFVAVACVLMAVVSLLKPARWAEQLRRHGWWGPAVAMGGALQRRETDKK